MSDDRVTSPAIARRRGRRPKRLETTVEIRGALIAAACAAFCENGFHGTNTNEIAHRAGLAAGTLYNYFTDKIDIFLAVYDRWLLDEWRSIEALFDSGGRSPEAVAVAVTGVVVEQHRRWSRFRASLGLLVRTEPRVRAARDRLRSLQVERVMRLLDVRANAQRRAQVFLTLLIFETVCDAIAAGDASAAAVGAKPLAQQLALLLHPLIASRPPPPRSRR
jgi:AcrR family transcriptional regulator